MNSDKEEGTEQEEQNMGIEKIFYSFFTMKAGIPVFNPGRSLFAVNREISNHRQGES